MSLDALIDEQVSGIFDISLENGDLVAAPGLETAIVVSTMSDLRASADEAEKPQNRRGWIGDLVTPAGRQLGSKFWLVNRVDSSKQAFIEGYAEEALQWMIDDNILVRVEPTATVSLTGISLDVKLIGQNDASQTVHLNSVLATGT